MFKLDPEDNAPLYMQIVEQTKEAIVKGYLQNGDQMPSIRDMAKTLLVNESTVSRAYKELEFLGIINSVVGKGTFIQIDESKLLNKKEFLLKELKELLTEAIYIGITIEEVEDIYRKIQQEVQGI